MYYLFNNMLGKCWLNFMEDFLKNKEKKRKDRHFHFTNKKI